jgi:glycosyltransferase involved in cell wall biosynthesis
VLHVVKTSNGAGWAARQAAVLSTQGIEIHVAVPTADGNAIPLWEMAGAHIHIANLSLPVGKPWLVPSVCSVAKRLVANVKPDLIHSHFLSTTILLRLALGRNNKIPRVFQVPGPLHLEHPIPKASDLFTAGVNDFWIASSRCIQDHYQEAGVERGHVFLSYYGGPMRESPRTGFLRKKLGIDADAKIVGNINLIYPPKRILGHRVGLKCHEDVIDAIGMAQKSRGHIVGVLIGGTFGSTNTQYEKRLRSRAREVGAGKILMPGFFSPEEVLQSWPDFDCAVHVPLSENCGGVVEPLVAGVPTIAGVVGGLQEVVFDGMTGLSVEIRRKELLAEGILTILANPEPYRRMASIGRELVKKMFDVERTGSEIAKIYRHIVVGAIAPPQFSSHKVLDEISSAAARRECGLTEAIEIGDISSHHLTGDTYSFPSAMK